MKQKRLAGDYSNTKIISLLPSGGIPKVLDKNKHVLVYLWTILGMFPKLGEVSGAHGITPQEAFEGRYKDGSVRLTQLTVLALFILPKNPKKERGYDKELHRLINIHSQSLGFFCPGDDGKGNQERLENFIFEKHFNKLVEVLENYTGVSHSFLKEFIYRNKTQESLIERLITTLKDTGRALFNAHTAFGKSTCALHIVASTCKIGDVALFTTPIVETLDDTVEKGVIYSYHKPIKMFTNKDISGLTEKKILDEIRSFQKTHIVFICLSVQDLRYKDEAGDEGDMRVKFSFLEELPTKLWIRDEFHVQYNADKTKRVLANVKAEMVLDLTATVYRLLEEHNDYIASQIHRCDNIWAIHQKHIAKNPDYSDFPDIDLCCVSFEKTLPESLKTVFTKVEEEYREKKLFECKNEKFVQLDSLVELGRYIFDSQVMVDGTLVTLSEKKNPFCARIATDLPLKTFGLLRIPEGDGSFTAKQKCELLKNTFNPTIKTTLFKTANDFVKGKKGPGKTAGWLKRTWEEALSLGKTCVVIITHEQLGVGTDIPPLSFAYLFDRISSPDVLVQFLGRMQRVFFGKTKARCYVMAPGMAVGLSAMMYSTVKDFSSDPKVQKELYDCISLRYYLEGDNQPHTFTFTEATKNNNVMLNRAVLSTDDFTHRLFSRFEGLDGLIAAFDLDAALKDNFGKGKDGITGKTAGENFMPPADFDEGNEMGDDKNEKKKPAKLNPKKETLMVMFRTVLALNVVEPCETLEKIWETDLAKVWFTPGQLGLAKLVTSHPAGKTAFQPWFEEEKQAIKNTDLHDIVLGEKSFLNEKFLVKPGMVYVPKALGEEVVERMDDGKTFVVFNALNGMLPCLLQKKYPKAKIACIEHFPYFVKHLTNMGFKSYLYSDNDWKTMHFDGAILNPPYNGNLDLEFILEAKKIADHVVAVHPAISTISRKTTKRFVDFKKALDGNVSYIKLFNGNPIFGIGLFYPCEIIDIDSTKTFKKIDVEYSYDNKTIEKHTFKSLMDVTKWGNVPEYYSLEKKILDSCETKNCYDVIGCVRGPDRMTSVKGKWYVNLAGIRGNVIADKMFTEDFYTLPTKELVAEKETTKHMWFAFQTKEEAQNMLGYLKSDFARLALSIFKTSANIHSGELASVPYLPSYSTSWTKARLTKLFNITDKEWAFIEKVIPKYYD